MESIIGGKLVAATAASYDFNDQKSGERKQGVSYRIFVAPSFETMPQELACNLEQYHQALEMGAGADVTVGAIARANLRRGVAVLSLTVQSLSLSGNGAARREPIKAPGR
jgi:hypothetical protein